ncbi:MAG: CAP domain-containing protein [Pyrinomonadaceae bacterium]
MEKKFAETRAELLQLVNQEREVQKVSVLSVDPLATIVASAHAEEMAKGAFASHWGLDGLKPYHRYSFAGGTDATQENISAVDNRSATRLADLQQDASYLHVRLYQEKPPNDGHRRSILSPQHTHVGFGLAIDQLRLRLVEIFVAKYVQIRPMKRQLSRGARVIFSGRLLKSSYVLHQVEVFDEPLPKPPPPEWFAVPRPYSLPDSSVALFPRLEPPLIYADGRTGVIDVFEDGSFSVPIQLHHGRPAIYTLVCWVKRRASEKAFPATEVCLRAE